MVCEMTPWDGETRHLFLRKRLPIIFTKFCVKMLELNQRKLFAKCKKGMGDGILQHT